MNKSGWKVLKLTQAFVYADRKLLNELLLFAYKKDIRETVERKECVIYEIKLQERTSYIRSFVDILYIYLKLVNGLFTRFINVNVKVC